MSIQFSADPVFHYEIIRSLGGVRYFGGDLGEQLAILPRIQPGNTEDWYREWNNLAKRVLSTIDESKEDSYSAATLRDVYFRASHYFFMADFFLHGNPDDPRMAQLFESWRKYFDKANARMAIPGQHHLLPTAHGFDIPIIVYRAQEASASNPRPTLILGGGFDSNYEECMHAFGFAALERGYNVILYEGPGQPSLVRKQKVGFIHDWEKAVTPIVDYVLANKSGDLSFIDSTKLGLVGLSLGGYLAARAAAFEPRLAAVLCIDGVLSFPETVYRALPGTEAAFAAGDEAKFNEIFDCVNEPLTTNRRWVRDHTKHSFVAATGFEAFKVISKMTIADIADKIKMPAFIADAEDDHFFGDQPTRVVRAIGDNATHKKFTREHAASYHCQTGALAYLNQEMLEWFGNVVGK